MAEKTQSHHLEEPRTGDSAPSSATVPAGLVLAIGLGALVAWSYMMLSSANPYHTYVQNGVTALERAYFFIMVANVLTFVALGFAGKRIEAFLEGSLVPIVATAVLTAGGAAVVLFNTHTAVLALAGLPTGCAHAVLLMAFALKNYHLAARDGLVLAIVAYGIAIVLMVAAAWIPTDLQMWFVLALGLVAGGMLLVFNALNIDPIHHSHIAARMEVRPGLALGFAVLVGVWAGVADFARSLYVHLSLSSMSDTLFLHTQSFSLLLIMTIVIASMVGLLALPKVFKLSLPYRIVFLITLVAVVLLPLATDTNQILRTYSVSSSAVLLIGMVAWILALAIARTRSEATLAVLARIRACWAAGTMAGFAASLGLYPRIEGNSTALAIAAAVLVAVLVLTYLGAFTEADADQLSQLYPSQRRERFRSKCERIGAEYGLSERETEVMMHFAMGHNAERIAEELFISYNTATTHRKHIYQKLDVHSQQELIDLLDQ